MRFPAREGLGDGRGGGRCEEDAIRRMLRLCYHFSFFSPIGEPEKAVAEGTGEAAKARNWDPHFHIPAGGFFGRKFSSTQSSLFCISPTQYAKRRLSGCSAIE